MLKSSLTSLSNVTIVAINNPVDWESMDYQLFNEQSNPFGLEKISNFILAWDSVANLSYFNFRNRIHQIAKKNWSKLSNVKITSSSKELELHSKGKYVILICDDDDWYKPGSIGVRVHDCDLVTWNPVAYTTTQLYANKSYVSPFFDFEQKRMIYTNNWCITKKGYESIDKTLLHMSLDGRWSDRIDHTMPLENRKRMQVNLIGNNIFKHRNCIKLNEHNNLANKTIASCTATLILKPTLNSFKQLARQSQEMVEIPQQCKWAKEEIRETQELYRETFGGIID